MAVKLASYKLQDLTDACRQSPKNVFVWGIAISTARQDFNLNTMDEVIAFIGNDGLEKPEFIRTKPWENNPNKEIPIMVDSYNFFSGDKYGYIAFFRNHEAQMWTIKSFKKNEEPDPKFRPFAGLDKLIEIPNKLKGGGK